jgi:hypothetical protein
MKRLCRGIRIRDIKLIHPPRTLAPMQFLDHLFCGSPLLSTGDRHPRAGSPQGERNGPTNTARGSRHHRDFPL